MPSSLTLGALALACGWTLAPSRPPEIIRKPPEAGLHVLSQEIHALSILYALHLTTEQLAAVQKLARHTAAPEREYARPKASDDYRSLLAELRKVLVDASDADRIEDLDEKVRDLEESEQPEVDDGFEVTAAARKHVPDLFRLLKPAQLAGYLGALADEVQDPADELAAALELVREREADAWKEYADDLAEDLGWLAGGLKADKSQKVQEGARKLLAKARGLTDEQFKAQKSTLEKSARELIGAISPAVVLRHQVERHLAELLSNPQLHAVLKARLQPTPE